MKSSLLGQIDVMVLCGGLGTRLRSALGETPKVLAPVEGQPFLELLLRKVAQFGFKRFVLCTGYKADEVEKYFRSRDLEFSVLFSRESEPLGTGGAIKQALPKIRGQEFVILNGDSFPTGDIAGLVHFHHQKKAAGTIMVSPVEDTRDYGSIQLNSDACINAFVEKAAPALDVSAASSGLPGYVNAGVYCFSQQLAARFPQADKFSLEKDFFPLMVGQGLYGFVVTEKFLDIGTPDRYQAALKSLKKQKG